MANKPGNVPLPRNVARLKPGNERRNQRLAPPSAVAQKLIAAHLAEHGVSPFRLGEHVHLGGSRPASQLISWDPGRASFRCQRCPGRVFASGEVTEAMVERALLFDPALQPFLAGAVTDPERRQIARAYLAGELTTELLRPWRKRARRQTAARRPSVEHRVQRVQEWMLRRYVMHGVLERVIEEAVRLPPEAWQRLAGRPALAPSTLRRYWQQIPDQRIAAAKAAYQAGKGDAEVDLSK